MHYQPLPYNLVPVVPGTILFGMPLPESLLVEGGVLMAAPISTQEILIGSSCSACNLHLVPNIPIFFNSEHGPQHLTCWIHRTAMAPGSPSYAEDPRLQLLWFSAFRLTFKQMTASADTKEPMPSFAKEMLT